MARIKGVEEVRVHPVSAMTAMQLEKAAVPVRVAPPGQKVRPALPDPKDRPVGMTGEGLPGRMIEEDPPVAMIGEDPQGATRGGDPREVMIGGDPLEETIGGDPPVPMIGEGPPVGTIPEDRPEGHVGMTVVGRMRLAREDHRSLGKRRAGMNAPSARETRRHVVRSIRESAATDSVCRTRRTMA